MHEPAAPTVTPVSEATVLDACGGRDLPRLGTVEQQWETDPIPEAAIPERAAAAVDALALDDVPDGGSVAVGVGSRGITNLPAIVAGVVGELDARGYEPFVVPAMGSHGGATAEGQRAKLEALGVTAERVGCPIRPTMETVTVGTTSERGIDVALDANAAAADAIVPINRVKQHTDFEGRVESGLSKMLVIGLGKQRGAKTAHEWAIDWSFRRMIPEIASLIVEEAPVVGGVALVEDQRDDTAVVEGVPPSGFLDREAELLETARELLPTLPFDDVDVLVVDRMGKDISGSGMDTNVIGRRVYGLNEPPPERPDIKRIYVRTLTEPSHGNAAALGLADFVGADLLADLDLSKTVINGLTASTPRGMRVPPPVETDRAGLVAALSTVGVTPTEELRVLRITDTMRLERVYASGALVAEARERDDLRVVSEPEPVDFDDDGSFAAPSPVDPEH
ncbi:DUF362 domain-containing protein [Halobium salinum]|uniref:DUF362 domain-containing protein n=1 Tax=Halobium salinum TaxID=1364940 RepID=A0ABD5PHK9_9EURY|nr:DUF362 domain-containing protein [Halobium salinum]